MIFGHSHSRHAAPPPPPAAAPLTAKRATVAEARLLATLRGVSPAFVSKADLMAALWPEGVTEEGRKPQEVNLRVLVASARRKLVPGASIGNDRNGAGYQLILPDGMAW